MAIAEDDGAINGTSTTREFNETPDLQNLFL
jgi:hypothetical protein